MGTKKRTLLSGKKPVLQTKGSQAKAKPAVADDSSQNMTAATKKPLATSRPQEPTAKQEAGVPTSGSPAALDDWPEPSPENLKIKAAVSKRWRALGNNREFVLQTVRLKWKFGRLYRENPELIRRFFRPRFSASLRGMRQTLRNIAGVKDQRERALLTQYLSYAARYGVVFELSGRQPYFRVMEGEGNIESRFRVTLKDGLLQPTSAVAWDTAFADSFGSEVKATPDELEALVRNGLAKFAVIDDKDEFSVFRQLFSFAYSPDQITAFRYNSLPQHTLFVIGENVSLPAVWEKLRTVVASEQRELASRDPRGRQPDLRREYKYLNTLVRGNGSQTSMAYRLLPVESKNAEGDELKKIVAVQETQLSQFRRRLREQ